MSQSETAKSAEIIERGVWTGALALAGAMIVSSMAAHFWFTASVSAGGVFILLSLWSLAWMAKGWSSGARAWVAVALFGKLWIAAGILYVMLRYAAFEPLGVVLGMGVAMGAFFVSVTRESHRAMQSATEGPNDA